MANSSYETLEVRFVIQPDWTVCHVLLSPASDGTLGVQGWHTKRFPPRMSTLDIMNAWAKGDEAPVLWPQEAPEPGR